MWSVGEADVIVHARRADGFRAVTVLPAKGRHSSAAPRSAGARLWRLKDGFEHAMQRFVKRLDKRHVRLSVRNMLNANVVRYK
jgi:hypothetical protein